MVLLRNSKGENLYCIAFEITAVAIINGVKKQTLKCDTEYMHAENASHARACFFAGNPRAAFLHANGTLKIVGIAPVVGMHALDDNGDNLQA